MSVSHDFQARSRKTPDQLTNLVSCPICGRLCDRGIFGMHRQLEERTVALLHRLHPDWVRESGACPNCAADAVQLLLGARSNSSLQHSMQVPYPVYAADEIHLLPTPVRIRSHPHFAGRRVTIAFLDSGFYPHPDLTRPRNRILRYVDATESEPAEKEFDKKPRVEKWHGTMTTCVGAGNGFMSDGLYAGIASEAALLLVKTGSARSRRIHDRDILRALEWVIAAHVRDRIRVVNISLGGDHPAGPKLSELDALVEEASALGIVVVAAAGNSGMQSVYSPAAAPSAIAVGGYDDQNSLDRNRWRLYHSDYGLGAGGGAKPELLAPATWLAAPMLVSTETHNEGMFLWRLLQSNDRTFAATLETTMAREYFKQRTLRLPIGEIRSLIRTRMIEQKFIHAHYQHVDGTSFAAPIISAIVAQMLEANPTLSPEQVRSILTGTAVPLIGEPLERQGHGAVDAARAVAGALRAAHGPLAGLPISPAVEPWGVTFICHAPEARDVAVVSSFNQWQPAAHPMRELRPGIWHLTIPRPAPGVYAYKYYIDHSQWVRDPENSAVIPDGYGGFHSLLTV